MNRILLIDDDNLLGQVLKHAGKKHDMDIHYYESLFDALYSHYFDDYNAVIIDCSMPVIHGEEILTYMRRFNPKVPLDMLSSDPHRLLKVMKEAEGFVHTISKSGGPEQILGRIKEVLQYEDQKGNYYESA